MLASAQAANLALRFLLELTALAVLAYWGWQATENPWRVLLTTGCPVLLALAWGAVASPKARLVLAPSAKVRVQMALLAVPVAALWHLDRTVLAAAFAGAVIGNAVLMELWRQ